MLCTHCVNTLIKYIIDFEVNVTINNSQTHLECFQVIHEYNKMIILK